ncbi:MAG: exonuclease SbcCD subunit D [Promethearchaeota archaeon]
MPEKIIFIGDAHIGINFPYKRNITTGISERSLDYINNVKKIIDYAIKIQCKLLIFTGDLYDRPNVSATFRKKVREQIFLPLAEAKIPVLIISGNHDSPMSFERGSSIEDLDFLPNVKVFRKPKAITKKIDGKSIGLILLPYLHPSQIITFLEGKIEVGPIDIKKQYSASKELLKNWIIYLLEDLETDIKIIVGHYYLKGTQISSDYSPEVLPGEFTFTESMIPYSDVDLCVFGHVHVFQELKNGKIVIPGSVEHIDFGERGESKGFIIFDIDIKKWEFKKLKSRQLFKGVINIPDDTSPTKYCLKQINQMGDLKDAIVRLEITASLENEMKLNLQSIENALEGTFYFEIKFIQKQTKVDQTILESYTLDPIELLSEFIDQAFYSYEKKDRLKKTAIEIINSLIESEE